MERAHPEDIEAMDARAPAEERGDPGNPSSIPVWASATGRTAPLGHVVPRIETVFDDNVIRRLDRKRALEAQADEGFGAAEALRQRIAAAIDSIELPAGFEFEWQGEKYDFDKTQAALAAKLPLAFGMIVLIVIMLFDRIKKPAIIFLAAPLALAGVTVGLLLTDQPFGFMALLGFLSLTGMLIKNSIVFIDATGELVREGKDPCDAVIEAGASRMRPVMMAALTTMLGLLPFFQEAFLVAMAVTIVFGLGFATFLTLLVAPTLYAIFFRIRRAAQA